MKAYRRFKDGATHEQYETWRRSPPASDTPLGNAYNQGRQNPTRRNPYPRGSLSFVAYAAGVDNAKETLSKSTTRMVPYKPTSLRIKPDSPLARELAGRPGSLPERLNAMAEDLALLREAQAELVAGRKP